MKIKNHEIIAEISRGALTTVYKARHLNLDRPVLLKVLNQQWLGEKDLLDRFRREARISARLQHKNIVNVYDFEVSENLVYISLEFVEGQTLQQYIRDNKNLAFEQILSVFMDLLRALAYAHKSKVIHRDIKPANILLDKTRQARLTDFGLASLADAPEVTSQGQSMGTPAYMAPEQIQGGTASPQSDLYSLGMTIYEMLSGVNPHQKDNIASTLQCVLNNQIPDIRKIRNDIPDSFAELLIAMLSPDPENRPQDAQGVLKQIEKFNVSEKESSQTVFKRSPKIKFTVQAALFLTVIAAALIIFWPSKNPSDKTQSGGIDTLRSESPIIEATKIKTDTALSTQQAEIDRPNKGRPTMNMALNTVKIVKETNAPLIAGKGTLFITCSPWAKVFIDGDSIDVTPMRKPIILEAGAHQLKLENPNYFSHVRKFDITSGKSDTISVSLKPAFGYLSLKVSPWAKLYINGRYREDTPLSGPIVLASGQNIIKLSNPAFRSITDTLYIKPGQTIEKRFTFAK